MRDVNRLGGFAAGPDSPISRKISAMFKAIDAEIVFGYRLGGADAWSPSLFPTSTNTTEIFGGNGQTGSDTDPPRIFLTKIIFAFCFKRGRYLPRKWDMWLRFCAGATQKIPSALF